MRGRIFAMCMALLGERIRERRQELKLTQTELAQKTGLGQSSINRLENGDTPDPRASTLNTLSAALGVTPEWLQGLGDCGFSRSSRPCAPLRGAARAFTRSGACRWNALGRLFAVTVPGAPASAARSGSTDHRPNTHAPGHFSRKRPAVVRGSSLPCAKMAN